jgi:hypothetical protein
MSFWILGYIPQKYRKEWNDPPYSEVYSFDGEDSEQLDPADDGFEGIRFRSGNSSLWAARRLWDMLGSQKGQELKQMIDEKIISDRRNEDEEWFMDRQDIQQILSLLDGLNQATLKIADENHYVRPEFVQYVLDNEPDVLHIHGNKIYDLGSTLAMIQRTAKFLHLALELNRDAIWN